tara:strand:- start:1000 stop:1368 length:369 start_codon:yes stop_codon:yes gene_type:complete
MYVTDFICTYNKHELSDQNTIYQEQFLQAFGVKEWNDDIINKSTLELYNSVKDNQDIKDILEKIKKNEKDAILMLILGCEDIDVFKSLFRFNLFDLTHRLLCTLLTTGKVDKKHKINLLSNI